MKNILPIVLLAMQITAGNRVTNLQRWYDGYNEVYFNNSLPKDTIVAYGETGHMGLTTKNSGRYTITISYIWNPDNKEALITLQHEMCHVATYDEFETHGPRWLKCMHNLADRGAMDALW